MKAPLPFTTYNLVISSFLNCFSRRAFGTLGCPTQSLHSKPVLFSALDLPFSANFMPKPPFYKIRTKGKPYYVYMTAGANKFLRTYYGRVKEQLASLENTNNS